MIRKINESKTLANYISENCKCEFDGRKCKSIKISFGVKVKNLIKLSARVKD